MNSRDEIEIMHPMAAAWLTEHGYEYEYEKRMPIRGFADFFAWNAQGECLILDCKIGYTSLEQAVRQVIGYCRQFDTVIKPTLAFPRNVITDYTRRYCDEQGVTLVPLPLTSWRLRLDPDVRQIVDAMADEHGVSVGVMIRRLLETSPEMIVAAEKRGFTLQLPVLPMPRNTGIRQG